MCIFYRKLHNFRGDVCHFFLTTRRNAISMHLSRRNLQISQIMACGREFFCGFAKTSRKICGVQFSAKREIGRKNSDGMAVVLQQNCRAVGGFLKIPYACRFGQPRVLGVPGCGECVWGWGRCFRTPSSKFSVEFEKSRFFDILTKLHVLT